MAEQLDPRFAALAETERIEMIIGHVSARLASENATLERLVGEGARAIAFGLVYVGDQIGRLAEGDAGASFQWPPPSGTRLMLDGEEVDARRITMRFHALAPDPESVYKQALERIAKHEEHMGSGPPDDEMREIAIGALAVGER